VDKVNFTGEMKIMAIDGHYRGLERIHNKEEKDANANGIKKINQEEYDKEMIELRERLNVIHMFLHRNIAES
jgi:hypothetical protein